MLVLEVSKEIEEIEEIEDLDPLKYYYCTDLLSELEELL